MSDAQRAYGAFLGVGLSLLTFMYLPTWLFILLGLIVASIGCWYVARFLTNWIFSL